MYLLDIKLKYQKPIRHNSKSFEIYETHHWKFKDQTYNLPNKFSCFWH